MKKTYYRILLHSNPFGVARAFKTLNDAKILNSLNIILILNDRDPYSMAHILTVIKDVGLLQNKDIINLFIGYGGSDSLRGLLNTLYQSDLLKEENIKVVLTHLSPEQMILALKKLNQSDYLNAENRKWLLESLLKHRHPISMVKAFEKFNEVNLLKKENIKWLLEHDTLHEIASILESLKKNKLLSEKNLKLIQRHSDSPRRRSPLI